VTQLSTTRLELTLMTLDEKALLFELDQDPAVMKYINAGKPTSMHDIEEKFIPRLARYLNPDKGWGLWKVIGKDSLENQHDSLANEFIGWILVRPMGFFTDSPRFDDIELGWRFKQLAWGKGVATEAAFALVTYLSAQKGVTAVSAIAVEENVGSIKVMKKLGMKFMKKAPEPEGHTETEVVFYQRKL
jgi:RimJ/RimL family protein N-acetyltransferase